MPGFASTCEVMDWIEQNDCPTLYHEQFEFEKDIVKFYGIDVKRTIIVSSYDNEDDIDMLLLCHPIEEWNAISKTQSRIGFGNETWICRIIDQYYFMSI